MSQSRTDAVSARFTMMAAELEVELHALDPDRWPEAPSDATNLHRPFGYLAPTLDDLWVCPALIAEQTNFLDDERFGQYLDVLEVHIYGHITHIENPNAEDIIDKAIYDIAPGSVELFSEVQMNALDRQGESHA